MVWVTNTLISYVLLQTTLSRISHNNIGQSFQHPWARNPLLLMGFILRCVYSEDFSPLRGHLHTDLGPLIRNQNQANYIKESGPIL